MLLLNSFIFLFGAIFGSFLNVIIYRVPRGLNIVTPRSRCTQCNKVIYWYENIPLLSYIFLRGKCSKCKTKIPFRYFIVELIAGLAALYLFPSYFTLHTLFKFIVLFSAACVFICHFFIDLEHKILPNPLNLYLSAVFLLYAVFFLPWQHWLFGVALGGGFPYFVSTAFYLITKKEGLGLGDVKLFGALGIYLGPMGIVTNVFLSCMLGSIVGITLIVMKKMNRNNHIPFGPFIILAASLQIFFPQFMIYIPLPF